MIIFLVGLLLPFLFIWVGTLWMLGIVLYRPTWWLVPRWFALDWEVRRKIRRGVLATLSLTCWYLLLRNA